MEEAPRILVADDQPDVLMALRLLFKGEGCETEAVSDPEAAYRAAAARRPSLLLMDLNYTRDTTSGEEGLALLERIQGLPAPPPVVVMTAWGSIELAVEAMRRGARDFVPKPWENARLLETVRKHLAPPEARRDGLARDLEIARQVQRQLLPKRAPALETLELDGHCRPAGLVGGDFFDWLDLGPGRAGLVLADISGKGMAAALLMANLQAAIRSLAPQMADGLPGMLRALNQHFLESTAPEHYSTLMVGLYEEAGRVLRYVNCGHPEGLVLREGEVAARMEATAPVLGVLREYRVEVGEVVLKPGDRVVWYSDGASEPFAGADGLGGERELLRLLRESPEGGAEEHTESLARMQEEQADDITVLVARAR